MKLGRETGFTLIELMIVVAIIGILASIAMLQYQDFISRSQLARTTSELSGYKSSIEEHLMKGEFDFTSNDIGYVKSNLTLDIVISNVQSVGGVLPLASDFDANGAGSISVQIDNTGANQGVASLSGTIVNIVRSSDGSWLCVIDSTAPIGAGGWKESYLPSGCN
jgi:type IV pilus assembly protein PilA